MRNGFWTKKLAIGIICLLVGTSIIPNIPGADEKKEILPHISQRQYTLVRDDYGVPHIFANTTDDLAFGAGYAIAEDRLWQADLFRREATGRLSEFGLASLEYDYQMRLKGYTKEETTKLFETIISPYKEMLIAYTTGMNQYIAEALADPVHKMPLEYLQRGLTPEPWTVEDSLAIAQMMVRRWGEGGGNEMIFTLVLFSLMQKNGPLAGWKIFNDACPLADPGAATTLNGSGNAQTPVISPLPPMIPAGIIPLAKEIVEMKQMDKEITEANGLLYHFGSNGWVVTPKKSASGNALLLGGPQMGYSIPEIVVEIGLHGAGINATGMTFPGVGPAIAIGVSQWGAWTTTSGVSDGIDTYIEILNPFNRTKYLFNHRWCPMERRVETIYDRNGTPHEFECLRTVHGPVLSINWTKSRGGFAISQRMAFWKEEQHTLEGVMSFQQCHNITEFEQGVSKIVSSHNWFWADHNGDVGYYHAGWYPIRPKYGLFHRVIDKRFPLIGTGKEEWLGIVPFSKLPQGRNPESGFYANWNTKPRADWPYSEAEFGTMWGEGDIVVRIQELLAADDSVTFDDMI